MLSSYSFYYVGVVDFGLELESTTSRYRKLIDINQNDTKTYGQWVDMCIGKLLSFT